MNEEQRTARVAELVRAARAPLNGEIREIDKRIQIYEERYEMKSGMVKAELDAGRLRETLEICQWLMLVHRKELMLAHEARRCQA